MAGESKGTALVSGGAGFIGSHLCERLIKDGYRVICVDNFLTGSKDNVSELMNNNRFLLVNADVTKRLPDVINDESIDFIFHLASPASPNAQSPISYMAYPLETMDVNSVGTRRLLQLARKKKAKFLFASTSEVYGDPKVHPQTENYWGYVNPNGPRSCYDESKRFGEALTMVYVRKLGVNCRIVRIFNTYGPRMDIQDGRAIVNFIVQALQNKPITIYGKGKQTRSFCFVDDMVAGLKKAMFTAETKGEVFNIGNPDEYTILELAGKIKRAIKSESKITYQPLPPDDPSKRKPDITKAKKVLNWKPKVSFAQGLDKTIKFFREKLEDEI
jgi:nucleoside-diphosphate-sugar epimerase